MRRRVKVGIAVSLLAFAIVASLASPARASCVASPPLSAAVREAQIVFVGTVVDTENMRRWVTVDVSEVWKGNVEPEVEVRAGPKDPPGPMAVASSTDRHYALGETYLFVPSEGNGKVFRDDSCSSTTRYSADLEQLNPLAAPEPTASPSSAPTVDDSERERGGTSMILWWAAGVMIAAGAIVWLWIRFRRLPRS